MATDSSQSRLQTIATGGDGLARIIYDFISPNEELYLLQKIDALGNGAGVSSRWKDLGIRKSMYWGGTLTKSNHLLPTPFPTFMDSVYPNLLSKIDDLDLFEPSDKGKSKRSNGVNVCLVNEYQPNQGILPHTDGPAYQPLVVTVSLSSHTILNLTPFSSPSTSPSADPSLSFSIFLPPRSLLLLSHSLYETYHHSISSDHPFDSMEELKACINWNTWWEGGAQGLEGSLVGVADGIVEGIGGLDVVEEDDENEGTKEQEPENAGVLVELDEVAPEQREDGMVHEGTIEDKGIRESVAKRRLVEEGSGWERGRRISLTCRKVEKVRKGILRF